MQEENQLQHVIDLIEKTGDKAVVLENGRPAYVLMCLRDYEGLILGKSEVRGLTENEMLDKINREIAVWKSDQDRMSEIAMPTGRQGSQNSDIDVDGWDYYKEDDEDEFDVGSQRSDFARLPARQGGRSSDFRSQKSDISGIDDWDEDEGEDDRVELDMGRDEFDVGSQRSDFGGQMTDMPDFEDDFNDDDDDDDEFDIDREMRNMRKERDEDTSKSRFEEDRFYVEPVE